MKTNQVIELGHEIFLVQGWECDDKHVFSISDQGGGLVIQADPDKMFPWEHTEVCMDDGKWKKAKIVRIRIVRDDE